MIRMLLAALVMAAGPAAAQTYETYENARFGYRLEWPADRFRANDETENRDGRSFTTEDGLAKIVVYGADNTEKFSPVEYRTTLIKEFPGYEAREYDPRGKSWFVLSGFKGSDIYYQKVMFTCGDRRISVLSVTFPANQKPDYAPIVERVEDGFRAARCN